MQKNIPQTTICAAGLNILYNIGLNPIIDQSLDISFTDPFYLNADLCKLLNRSAYQGVYEVPYYNAALPTLYIDGKDMGIIANLKIQEIKALAELSPFGHGSKMVSDENVRNAFEIKGNRINLNFKLPYEVQKMAPVGYEITAKLNKLVIYEKDGLFAEHSDTHHGDDHIGILVMCLPVPYEGGTFILSDDRNELRLPFDEIMKDNKIPWVAFYNDVKHQVEVKSGMRMTLQFDLHVKPEVEDDDNNKLSAVFRTKYMYVFRKPVEYKLEGFNQDIINAIHNKLKTILSAPKIQQPEVKHEDFNSLIKKKDRPDDDEPFELEQPQPTKQPKLDSSGQDYGCDNKNAENKNPDGIALLLRRRYELNSLSLENLKGIDSLLYHSLKDDFKVEVKLVVMEDRSDNTEGYQGIEIIALSKFSELDDPASEEEEENVEVGLNNKHAPKLCKDDDGKGFPRFKSPKEHYYDEEEEEEDEEDEEEEKEEKKEKGEKYAGEVKKVYLITGLPLKTTSKLVAQNYFQDTRDYDGQEGIHSYMQAALFIYPK